MTEPPRPVNRTAAMASFLNPLKLGTAIGGVLPSIRREAMQSDSLAFRSEFTSLRREAVGETIGTFLFLTLGFGVICTGSLGGVDVGLGTIAVTWAVGVALGIGISSALSDSHLNPAVTFSMVLYKQFKVKRALVYMGSQVLGSTLAALFMGIIYLPQIEDQYAALVAAAELSGIEAHAQPLPFQLGWPGLPNHRLTHPGSMLCYEAIAAAILVALVFRLDPANGKPQHLGAAVGALILVFAPLSGAGFNPARDLGPRIAAGLISGGVPGLDGFGGAAWWPYTFGPFIGAAIGGGLHEIGQVLEKNAIKAKADAAAAGAPGTYNEMGDLPELQLA
jgi:glycerol uptake facilitator protein